MTPNQEIGSILRRSYRDPTLNRGLAVHSSIPDIRAALLQKYGLAHHTCVQEATVSQLITKPSGAQSVKVFVGTGGAGGAGQSMNYNNNTGNWTGFSLVAGGNGGNGFVSVADPNSGGIEVDLLSIVNRLTAAGI